MWDLGDDPGTEELVRRADEGDGVARQRLLARHRKRLRSMVAGRLDRRLSARVDPSDVVQDALADAGEKLDDYLLRRPLPFYPWLLRLAVERLIRLRRHHIGCQKRGVGREVAGDRPLADGSGRRLADNLAASGTSPSRHAIREESRHRLLLTLDRLAPPDREILVLKYLEGLNFGEIAARLGVKEGTVKVRHFRALDRVRKLLGEGVEGGDP